LIYLNSQLEGPIKFGDAQPKNAKHRYAMALSPYVWYVLCCEQRCGVGVVRSRRFLGGVGVGFLTTLGVGVGFFVRLWLRMSNWIISYITLLNWEFLLKW